MCLSRRPAASLLLRLAVLLLRAAQIAHAAGLSAAFVDPKARGMHAITVTGWVAVACVCAMVLVVLGMLTFALWRWSCGVRRQHQYAAVGSYKQGDV